MLSAFQSLVRFIRFRTYYIDESIFRLHCLYTSTILFFFFIIITTKQIVGEPIDCDTNRDSVKASVLNTYCYIRYTYTIYDESHQRNHINSAAPGVRDGQNKIFHNYYQWVWFVFFVQALCFYIPRWIWKSWEGGMISNLVSGTDFNGFAEETNNKKTFIVNYLIKNRGLNESYARHYIFVMILALSNVLAQMYFIDYLFNGEFYKYGLTIIDLLSINPESRHDALIKIFPRVSKCQFFKFGASGSLQEFDAICVLPLNMYYEKIFIFLWFWYYIVALLLFISIIIKIILMLSPIARFYYIRRAFNLRKSWNRRDANRFDAENLPFGETFVLLLIKQNIGPVFSKEILQELILRYESQESTRFISSKEQTKIDIQNNIN